MTTRTVFPILFLFAANCLAADFDGDGVPDEFTITREAEKVAKESGVGLVNPWLETGGSKKSPKGSGLVIRLSRSPQKFLVHDFEFFKVTPWKQEPPVRVITKKDKGYAAWKKQVPALRADAIELGTEAGIDILLYWEWPLAPFLAGRGALNAQCRGAGGKRT